MFGGLKTKVKKEIENLKIVLPLSVRHKKFTPIRN